LDTGVRIIFRPAFSSRLQWVGNNLIGSLKQWKLSEIDLQVQARWDDFSQVKYEMLKRTHTLSAPWTIIRADSKHRARLNAIKVILNSIDYEGRNEELDYRPDPGIVCSGAEELEKMNADLLRDGQFIE
jgi:hypothetical protein